MYHGINSYDMTSFARNIPAMYVKVNTFSVSPLPEPMLAYCWLDQWEQIGAKLDQNSNNSVEKKNAFQTKPFYE